MRSIRWEPVLLFTTLLLLGATFRERTRADDAVESLRAATPDMLRARALDQLTSQDLTEILSDGPVQLSGSPFTVLWLLDVEECPGCLADTRPWNRLAEMPEVERIVVMAGADEQRVRDVARAAGLTGEVVADPNRNLATQLRVIPPSTKVLLSSDGSVLFVDARYPAQACNWNLETILATMLSKE